MYDILVYLAMAAQHDQIYKAVKSNDYDAVVLAVESAGDVNGYFLFPSSKFYCLYEACHKDGKNDTKVSMRIIKYLISKGADLNSINGTLKLTPLHLAAYCGYDDYVAVLLEAGASTDIIDGDGRNAFECARSNQHFETAAFIKSYHDVLVKGCHDG